MIEQILQNLDIHILTRAQYNELVDAGEIDNNGMYYIDDGISAPVHKVTSAEYEALVAAGEIEPDDFYVITDADGFEEKSNRVTSIDGSADNAHYPTAKAVYDFVMSIINSNE